MLNKKAIIVIAAALSPLSANAYEFFGSEPSHFSYNFAQAELVTNEYDSGFLFGGSYDVHNSIAITGSYTTSGDYSELIIGAAHHAKAGFLDRSDLIIHASLIKAALDLPSTSRIATDAFGQPILLFDDFGRPIGVQRTTTSNDLDETGIIAGATFRHQIKQLEGRLEVFGDASYSSVLGGEIRITGGAEWSFNEQFAVRSSLSIAGTGSFTAGARYYF